MSGIKNFTIDIIIRFNALGVSGKTSWVELIGKSNWVEIDGETKWVELVGKAKFNEGE